MEPLGQLYLGCAVWACRDWVGNFYPPKTASPKFLRCYSDRLNAVEANATFYELPTPAQINRWVSQTPPTFRFCPKVPQIYTHRRAILPHLQPALKFLDSISGLGDRLGPIMLQLPPKYGPRYEDDLMTFLARWPRSQPLAVEMRHRAWFEETYDVPLNQWLTTHYMSRVILDTRPVYEGHERACKQATSPEPWMVDPQRDSPNVKPQLPLIPVLTTSFVVVRYVGHPHRPINDRYLAQWTHRVADWLRRGITVFFFVHCPKEIYSPAIARDFHTRLRKTLPNLPGLPWETVAEEQLDLF